MKKLLVILSLTILTACQSVPVQQKFPSVSDTLMAQPVELKETPVNSSSSQVFEIVIENYGTYYELSNRLQGWQKWYIEQKKIYERNQ
jgi:hypothetical protein